MKALMKRKGDKGFSLLEVLIAVVILGLVGGVLLHGIAASNLSAKKNTLKQENIDYLTSAEQNILKEPYTPCSGPSTPTSLNWSGQAVPDPYSNLNSTFSKNVRITKVVEVFQDGTQKTACGLTLDLNTVGRGTNQSISQIITISTDPNNAGTSTLTKTFFKNAAQSPSQINTVSVRLKSCSTTDSSLTSISFLASGTATIPLYACSGTTPASGSVTFYTLPGAGLQAGDCSANNSTLIVGISQPSGNTPGSLSLSPCPGYLPDLSKCPTTGCDGQVANLQIAALEAGANAKSYTPVSVTVSTYEAPQIPSTITLATENGFADFDCGAGQACSSYTFSPKYGIPGSAPTFTSATVSPTPPNTGATLAMDAHGTLTLNPTSKGIVNTSSTQPVSYSVSSTWSAPKSNLSSDVTAAAGVTYSVIVYPTFAITGSTQCSISGGGNSKSCTSTLTSNKAVGTDFAPTLPNSAVATNNKTATLSANGSASYSGGVWTIPIKLSWSSNSGNSNICSGVSSGLTTTASFSLTDTFTNAQTSSIGVTVKC